MSHATHLLAAGRAAALFSSHLPAGPQPTPDRVEAAIRHAIRTYGVRGCAAEVAAAYGECPETAAPRMRWAGGIVERLYARTGQRHASPATASGAAFTTLARERVDA